MVRSIHSCPRTGIYLCSLALVAYFSYSLLLIPLMSRFARSCEICDFSCACEKSQKSKGRRFFTFTCDFSQLLVLLMIKVASELRICENHKANDFSRSLAIFRSSVIRNDYPARNRSISRSGFYGLATALRCFTMTCRGPLCSLHRLDDFSNFFQILQ